MFPLSQPFLITSTSHAFSAFIEAYNGDHKLQEVHSIDVLRGRAFTLIKKDGKILYHRKQVKIRRGEPDIEPVCNETNCDRIRLHPSADDKARFYYSEFRSKLPQNSKISLD